MGEIPRPDCSDSARIHHFGEEQSEVQITPLTSVGLLGAFLAPIGAGSVIGVAGYRPTFLIAGAVGVAGILLALRAPRPE